MTKHFTLKELTKSSTAKRNNIDNTPNEVKLLNLKYMAEQLEIIREKYGKPMYISSGYRSKELNRLVGGSKSSYHLLGLAVDIDNGSRELNRELFDIVLSNINELPIDELVNEYNFDWVHVSFTPKNCKSKRQIKNIK